MGIALLIASLAEAATCDAAEIAATAPADGAAEVPRDAGIALAFTDCGEPSAIPVELYGVEEDGSETALLADEIPAAAGRTARLQASACGMGSHDAYHLRIHNPSGTKDIWFHTTDATSLPLEGAPEALDRATWSADDRRVRLELGVAPAPDPYGLSVVEVREEDGSDVLSSALASECDDAVQRAACSTSGPSAFSSGALAALLAIAPRRRSRR